MMGWSPKRAREDEHAVGARRELAANRIELGADLESNRIEVRAPVKCNLDLRLVLAATWSSDLLDAAQRRERFLHRAGDLLLDFLRRGAGVRNGDLHAGKL